MTMTLPALPSKATVVTHVYELVATARYLIGNTANPQGTGFTVEAYKIYVYPDGSITVDLEGRPLNRQGNPDMNHPRMIVVDPVIEAHLLQQFREAQ